MTTATTTTPLKKSSVFFRAGAQTPCRRTARRDSAKGIPGAGLDSGPGPSFPPSPRTGAAFRSFRRAVRYRLSQTRFESTPPTMVKSLEQFQYPPAATQSMTMDNLVQYSASLWDFCVCHFCPSARPLHNALSGLARTHGRAGVIGCCWGLRGDEGGRYGSADCGLYLTHSHPTVTEMGKPFDMRWSWKSRGTFRPPPLFQQHCHAHRQLRRCARQTRTL